MKQRIALVVVLCVVSLLAYSLHSTASLETTEESHVYWAPPS